MRKTYIVKKVDLSKAPMEKAWDSIEEINIDNFLWKKNNYEPTTKAKLFYTDTHLHVFFKSYEEQIRVTYFNMNDSVCRDSCMEFFVNPHPAKDKRYFNFEMNSVGTLLLGLGVDRNGRQMIEFDDFKKFLNIKTSVTKENLNDYNGDFWTIEYSIPFSFFEEHFGKLNMVSGHKLEANFYKCGDVTRHAHYGAWNYLDIEAPDFHRSDYFGELILE